ncbi:b-cell receptor cd22 [Holotrichia oblita]|uniref:B-cell receptor cd22 n=1 Tax=Holotrichia oblita TaxID=644536 RepID=A0ACB9TXC1_HOLOL|nr:b-cell receptor cd22 [Holotrichia oblita]
MEDLVGNPTRAHPSPETSYEAKEGDRGTGTGIAKLLISLTRADLKREFKCVVESDALDEPLVETITADVDVKPTGIQLSGVKSHVVQGSFVKLLCEVTGAKPAAEVKWFNGTHEVSETFINTINKEMVRNAIRPATQSPIPRIPLTSVQAGNNGVVKFYGWARGEIGIERTDPNFIYMHWGDAYATGGYEIEQLEKPATTFKISKFEKGALLKFCLFHLFHEVYMIESDRCRGQNLNKFMAANLLIAAQEIENIRTINLKFLVSGHSELECESMHSAIAREFKRVGKALGPADWETIAKSARRKGDKPYIVYQLKINQINDCKECVNQKCASEKWQKMCWLRFRSTQPFIMEFKQSLNEEFRLLNVNKTNRRNSQPASHLKPLYKDPNITISEEKSSGGNCFTARDNGHRESRYYSTELRLPLESDETRRRRMGERWEEFDGVPPKFEGGTVDQLDLRINDVSREDHGNYTCICRNSVGSEESINHIFLNVQYPPTVELIIMEKMPIKAVDRKTITVACNIKEGNPQAISKVGWYLGGELLKELPECNYTSFDANGDGEGNGGPLCSIDSHILSLENVSESFAGNYTCMIKNLAGWGPMSPPQELIVYYPPSSARLKATSTNVIKKSSVTLLCSVDNPGKPDNVTYVWHRGTQLVSDITTYNWTINPVMYETKNKYTCYARNEGGDGDPASIFINVTAPPKFIDRLQPYNGILYTRDNISFTCRIECSPICNISWLKNGLQIPKNDPQYSFKETTYPPDPKKNDFESIESTLIFNMDQWPGKQLDKTAQNTVYTCQSSSNGIGSPASSDALVAVDYPPENLTVSKKIIDVQENSRPEIINCTGRGHPTLTYVWKNERNVNVSTNHILSLKPVNRADAGTYSCVASNKHGNTSAEVYLNVQ